MIARRAAALASLVLCLPMPLRAETLPRVHVVQLGQHADRNVVAPHEPFHVQIVVLVREHRDRLDELQLGDLDNCEITGDERLHQRVPNGTLFTERLTLEARSAGSATISPAYLDAIDPVTGRALRYSSSPVRIAVRGEVTPPDTSYDAFFGALRAIAIDVGIGAAIIAFFYFAFFRRRSPRVAPPAPVAAAPALDTRVRTAADEYRARPEKSSLLHLRALLFESAGIPAGATLDDALGLLPPENVHLRMVLLKAEGALFGPEGDSGRSHNALIDALAVYGPTSDTKETV